MPAVHWMREWCELKWSRYRFLPAVLILRIFCSGCSSVDFVGSDSIYGSSQVSRSPRKGGCGRGAPSSARGGGGGCIYHLNRRVGEVNELGQNLSIVACSIQLCSVP